MKRNKWTKGIIIGLIMVIVFLTVSPYPDVQAAESENSGSSMTRSMIEFFRKDQTQIDVNRVSKDELMIYGVFLSNFFVPGKTKLKDLIDPSTDKDDTLPKQISNKFFGSTGNYQQIININNKLYSAITDVLKTSRSSFGLYASPPSEDAKVMSGTDLYNKLAGVDQDSKIYGNISSPDGVVMDLKDKATRASIQVLFSFAPELILDKEKGLRAFHSLYIDGLGNIWGAYNNVSIEEYVLILPSALNPVVFSKNTKNGKFPVANVFVMGGIVKITEDFLADSHFMTPYYNIRDYFTTGTTGAAKMNTNNMLNIFGLQSPSAKTVLKNNGISLEIGAIGETDTIIENSNRVESNPYEDIKGYLSETTESTFSDANSFILFTIDSSKFKDGKKYFDGESSLTTAQKESLSDYLFGGSVFSLNELADDMYYFNVTNGASGTDEGSWNNGSDDDLIKRQKLFAKEVDGNFTFYKQSYFSSPFNRFLKQYFDNNSHDVQKGTEFLVNYLKTHTLSKEVNPESNSFKALKSFLDSGNFGTEDPKVINNAIKLLKFDGNNFVYNLLPSSTSVNLNTLDSNIFKNTVSPTGFGLVENERRLGFISSAIRESSFWKGYSKSFPNAPYFKFEGTDLFSAGNGGEIVGYDDNGKAVGKNGQNAISTLFYNTMVYRIFGMNSTFASQIDSNKLYAGDKVSGALGEYTVKTAVMNGVNNYPGIYWGYMVQLLNIHKDGEVWKSEPYSNPLLPYMVISTLGGSFNLNDALNNSTGVVSSEERTMAEMSKDIIKKVYGLLSDGPSPYRDKLVKSAQDSWVIQTHRAITGSWIGNILSVSAGGNNSYASIVGYINSPSLYDLPLTSWVLDDYLHIYMLLLLFVLFVVILMVIVGQRRVGVGVLILLLMAFVLILPQFLLSNVINVSNAAGDKIYSERFNYWAITQHQQSISTINSRRGDEIDYIIAQNMEAAKNVYSTDVGVRVKWMSPKKDDVFDKMFNHNTSPQGLMSNLTIFRWLFNSFFTQVEYVYDNPLATYVYRPYNAIAAEAKNAYESVEVNAIDREKISNQIKSAKENLKGVPDYRFKLFSDANIGSLLSKQQLQLVQSVGAYRAPGTNQDFIDDYRYWILNNADVTKAIFRNDFENNVGINTDTSNPYYNAFSLSTESPFYYFYNVFRHRYSSIDGGFKSALLSKDVYKVNSENTEVNQKLRDFLDLEGLFTYVIPYLQQGNQYVHGWMSINGESVDGYDFANGVAPSDPELLKKYEAELRKKEDMKKVWKLYSPWVDQLYDLNVYNQKTRIANRTTLVPDALNPGAYFEVGRPMIFSEADMAAKHYRVSDLTDIETRIQATLKATYKDLLYLSNYRDFDDEVLITSAAMIATFNFNREFSEFKLLGESVMQYPQNYELKNFNYDAFMRLILLNATGEPLMSDKDLYVRIIDKTSFFTGLALLVNDLLAVMAIPTVKMVVLLLLLFLSIVICLSCVLVPPERVGKEILKRVGTPSLLFFAVSVGFAYLVSLFMGEGLTGYVGGRTPSLGVTDPSIMLLLMAIVDLVYIWLLWRLIKILFNSLKVHLIKTVFATAELGIGAFKVISNKLSMSKSDTFGGSTTKGGISGGVMSGKVGLLSKLRGGKSNGNMDSKVSDDESYSTVSAQLAQDYKNWSNNKQSAIHNAQSDNSKIANRTEDQSFQAYMDDLASKRDENKPDKKPKSQKGKSSQKAQDE